MLSKEAERGERSEISFLLSNPFCFSLLLAQSLLGEIPGIIRAKGDNNGGRGRDKARRNNSNNKNANNCNGSNNSSYNSNNKKANNCNSKNSSSYSNSSNNAAATTSATVTTATATAAAAQQQQLQEALTGQEQTMKPISFFSSRGPRLSWISLCENYYDL